MQDRLYTTVSTHWPRKGAWGEGIYSWQLSGMDDRGGEVEGGMCPLKMYLQMSSLLAENRKNADDIK